MKADVLLVDPGWKFKTYSDKGRGRCPQYHTEPLDLISALPVGDLAAENCAMFLWVTWPFMEECFQVVSQWGFDPAKKESVFPYKTLGFEWWKLNKNWPKYLLPFLNGSTSYHDLIRLFAFGGGYYGRANSEPCLLFVKGKMPVATRSERNFIISPLRQPSRKPDEQYRKIEALYPAEQYPNKIELFARQQWPGWISLGDRIDGRNLIDTIPDLVNDTYPVVSEPILWKE